jgi:hypothetical protein
MLGAVGGDADKHLRRCNYFPAGRVMLPDPRLIVAEVIEPLDQLQIAIQRKGRVVPRPVKRRQKYPEAQAVVLRHG